MQTSGTENKPFVPGFLPSECLAIQTEIVQYTSLEWSKQKSALTEQQNNNHWVSASLPPTSLFFLLFLAYEVPMFLQFLWRWKERAIKSISWHCRMHQKLLFIFSFSPSHPLNFICKTQQKQEIFFLTPLCPPITNSFLAALFSITSRVYAFVSLQRCSAKQGLSRPQALHTLLYTASWMKGAITQPK